MARWKPGTQGRFEEAAMELFLERGFEETTVADIAERAGLTKRTFFRYFADKREVLFSGAKMLEETFVQGVLDAPADAPPLDAVAAGLDDSARIFEEIPDRAGKRQSLIHANTELHERELIKMARLGGAVAEALRERGVSEPTAGLAAEAGIAVLRVGFERWAEDPHGQDLRALLRESLAELKSVTAAAT
jgi:AcrR family transcriptional regulator